MYVCVGAHGRRAAVCVRLRACPQGVVTVPAREYKLEFRRLAPRDPSPSPLPPDPRREKSPGGGVIHGLYGWGWGGTGSGTPGYDRPHSNIVGSDHREVGASPLPLGSGIGGHPGPVRVPGRPPFRSTFLRDHSVPRPSVRPNRGLQGGRSRYPTPVKPPLLRPGPPPWVGPVRTKGYHV